MRDNIPKKKKKKGGERHKTRGHTKGHRKKNEKKRPPIKSRKTNFNALAAIDPRLQHDVISRSPPLPLSLAIMNEIKAYPPSCFTT